MRTILPHTANPALRESARDIPLEDIAGPHIASLIADMKALLAKEEFGVALAAPQVGEAIKLFVVSGKALTRREESYHDTDSADVSEQAPEDTVYINPKWVKMSRKKTGKHEGCLSVRGLWGIVPRAEKVSLTAYDEHGKKISRGASGFLAHIFQHEMDHLEGTLYIDKATEMYDENEKADE